VSLSLLCARPLIFIPKTPQWAKTKNDVLLKLTLGFGVIVVEVLFPLCGGELTDISNKQIFIVVIAEPVHNEETVL